MWVPNITSPTRSWVMANSGYNTFIGSKTVHVPLREDYSHDVQATIKSDPDAGAYCVCKPTGTLTKIKDIEYLLANKKKDAEVVVDEAYMHLSDDAESAISLVAADKDVVVMRAFSKIYGMAGLHARLRSGRPDRPRCAPTHRADSCPSPDWPAPRPA
jgi:histidinol-phosphate aminotransferase